MILTRAIQKQNGKKVIGRYSVVGGNVKLENEVCYSMDI